MEGRARSALSKRSFSRSIERHHLAGTSRDEGRVVNGGKARRRTPDDRELQAGVFVHLDDVRAEIGDDEAFRAIRGNVVALRLEMDDLAAPLGRASDRRLGERIAHRNGEGVNAAGLEDALN